MPPHLTPSPSTTPPAHALLPHSQSLQTPRPLSCAFSPFYSRLPHLQTLLPLFLRVYPPSLQSCSRGGYFNPLIKNGSKNRPLIYCGLGRQLVQYLLIYNHALSPYRQTQNLLFPHKHIGRDLLHRAKTCLSFTVPTIPVGAGRWRSLLQ